MYIAFKNGYVSPKEYHYTARMLKYYRRVVLEKQVSRCAVYHAGDGCEGAVSDAVCEALCSESALTSLSILQYSVQYTPAIMQQMTGNYSEMAQAMTLAVSSDALQYSTVRQSRIEWFDQRRQIAHWPDHQRAARVHYVTFASNHTADLETLLLSAKLAGVEITVSAACVCL